MCCWWGVGGFGAGVCRQAVARATGGGTVKPVSRVPGGRAGCRRDRQGRRSQLCRGRPTPSSIPTGRRLGRHRRGRPTSRTRRRWRGPCGCTCQRALPADADAYSPTSANAGFCLRGREGAAERVRAIDPGDALVVHAVLGRGASRYSSAGRPRRRDTRSRRDALPIHVRPGADVLETGRQRYAGPLNVAGRQREPSRDGWRVAAGGPGRRGMKTTTSARRAAPPADVRLDSIRAPGCFERMARHRTLA